MKWDYNRDPLLRLRVALLLGASLLAGGTLGYSVIEHWHFLDALFMTVITLSSVGYGEVKPLDMAGQVFTICLIFVGLGTVAWLFTTALETATSEETRRLLGRKRMDHQIGTLKNHFIVCGYGRIGHEIAKGYTQSKVPFVVIETDEEQIDILRETRIPHVEGDAADDAVLLRAGIDRAAALITVTPTDAINTFIVLSARGLQPDLYIIARADAQQNEAKLLRAGASKIISPHVLGGRWMAAAAVSPAVTDFIAAVTEADHTRFTVREVVVSSQSQCAGMTFGEARLKRETGALVVAVRPATQARGFLPNPADSSFLNPGDTLIALGSPDQLAQLQRLLNPNSVSAPKQSVPY